MEISLERLDYVNLGYGWMLGWVEARSGEWWQGSGADRAVLHPGW